jgi:hypothetical protein
MKSRRPLGAGGMGEVYCARDALTLVCRRGKDRERDRMLAICHAKRRYNQALDLSPGARHAATLWRMVVRLFLVAV